jgi:hypothetical protein
MNPAERFWAKVDKNGPTPAHCAHLGPCWIWTAGSERLGYGKFGVQRGRVERSHRYAWELAHGTVPPGLQVLHQCDNRRCVNIAHLFLGTLAENMADMKAKGRAQRGSLPPDSVLLARRLYAEGATITAIAEAIGTSRIHAHRVATGKRHSRVPGTIPTLRSGASGGPQESR